MDEKDRETAFDSLLLSSIAPNMRDTVLARATTHSFERGETIFLQGDQARSIYVVLDGWVKLFRIAPSGAEAVVGVLTKGRSFGEAVAFRFDTYPVSAEAVTGTRLLRIEANEFLRQIERDPSIAIAILSATFTHLHSLVAQVEALKARSGAQRVAEFLLEMTDCDAGSCTITLPYDKGVIAARLGMKPESLSRAFSKLKDHGVRILQNEANIADVEALQEMVDDDPANAWSRGSRV